MAQATFTPTSNTFIQAFTTTAANAVLTNIGTSQDTLFKIDNASGNLAFVAFSANASVVANVSHPVAGTSQPVIAIRSGETTYVNPGIGTNPGNVYVGIISTTGTGNIYIQAGV